MGKIEEKYLEFGPVVQEDMSVKENVYRRTHDAHHHDSLHWASKNLVTLRIDVDVWLVKIFKKS